MNFGIYKCDLYKEIASITEIIIYNYFIIITELGTFLRFERTLIASLRPRHPNVAQVQRRSRERSCASGIRTKLLDEA